MQYDDDKAVDNCSQPRIACNQVDKKSNTPLGPSHGHSEIIHLDD